MNEIWKEIPGTDYSVSDQGRVASRKNGEWRILKQSRAAHGYLQVSFSTKNKATHHRVHRLVAEAFLGPPPTPKHTVNHKNGIKDDPRVENLEWMTQLENNLHAIYVLNRPCGGGGGGGGGRPTLTESQVNQILSLRGTGKGAKSVAADFGVVGSTICDIWMGVTWRGLAQETE